MLNFSGAATGATKSAVTIPVEQASCIGEQGGFLGAKQPTCLAQVDELAVTYYPLECCFLITGNISRKKGNFFIHPQKNNPG